MPSLLEKMFDTMPMKGLMGRVAKIAGSPEQATLGQMKRYVDVHRSPPALNIAPPSPVAGTPADEARIWGWQTTSDPSRVTGVTCRVRESSFAKQLVLESLDFGYAPMNDAKNLRRCVLAVFNGKAVELPLTLEYHLVSFNTHEGYIKANDKDPLWPLESYQDEALLHVFVYDLDRGSGAILPLTSPHHPDQKEVNALLDRLDQLNKAGEDDTRKAGELLFKDNLWDPTPSNTPPTATVPEDVDLSLDAVRVVVACSLTPCRERDDYQPGELGGVGRLYPHILVIATSALDRVEAAVHFKRPATTQMLDHGLDPHAEHHHDEHDEMLPEIKGLLVADSNAGGMALIQVPFTPGPVPYWANMFNYYVVDPINDPEVGTKLIPVVRRARQLVRNQVGSVTRDCTDIRVDDEKDSLSRVTNRNRVQKRERQGYFDNIHLAPRMRVKAVASVTLTYDKAMPFKPLTVVPADKTAWKMDEVAMAPFCVHDCFHIHWRWSDNQNNTKGAWGWGPVKPWSEVGRAQVPENQDVFLQLHGHAELTYLAHAHEVPKNAWQPICHHGAGYALKIKDRMVMARTMSDFADHMIFKDAKGNILDGKGWALFYWRLRYHLVPTGPRALLGQYHAVALEERFSFNNKHDALDL